MWVNTEAVLLAVTALWSAPLQVPVLSWFDDVDDAELLNLLPVFEELSGAEDVYARLDQLRGH